MSAPQQLDQKLTPRPALAGLFRLLTGVLFLGVLTQFYAAGLMWYGFQDFHREWGWLLMALAVLCVPTSFAAKPYGARPSAVLLLVGLVFLQPIFVFTLARTSPFLGALHALNGAVILVLSARIFSRARTKSCEPTLGHP